MIFNLNYGATIANVPLSQTQLPVFNIHFAAECPKSEPIAPTLIFDRLRTSLIKQFYATMGPMGAEESETTAGLIAIRGGTIISAENIMTDLDIYYFSMVHLFRGAHVVEGSFVQST